jgi:hypothetical protein
MYQIVRCGECSKEYANPFLILFDEDRPLDEMEVEL